VTAPNAESVRLEMALEAVLIRYGIPVLGITPGADRGDLASDLAAVARAQIDGAEGKPVTGPNAEYGAFADLLPDGAMPMFGFLIVSYMAEDGAVMEEFTYVAWHAESVKFRMTADQYNVVREDEE
jgi:hypothetical protein